MPIVLVVEDNDTHRLHYQTAFGKYEVEAVYATTIAQAMEAFLAHQATIQVVMLDNEVIEANTGIRTFELAQWLRESGYTGLIVAASGSSEFISKMNRLGLADAYGPKFMAAAITLSLLGIPG